LAAAGYRHFFEKSVLNEERISNPDDVYAPDFHFLVDPHGQENRRFEVGGKDIETLRGA
jgi:hypothetical protein